MRLVSPLALAMTALALAGAACTKEAPAPAPVAAAPAAPAKKAASAAVAPSSPDAAAMVAPAKKAAPAAVAPAKRAASAAVAPAAPEAAPSAGPPQPGAAAAVEPTPQDAAPAETAPAAQPRPDPDAANPGGEIALGPPVVAPCGYAFDRGSDGAIDATARFTYDGPKRCAGLPDQILAGCPTRKEEKDHEGKVTRRFDWTYDRQGRLSGVTVHKGKDLTQREIVVRFTWERPDRVLAEVDLGGDGSIDYEGRYVRTGAELLYTAAREQEKLSWTLDPAGRPLTEKGAMIDRTFHYDEGRLVRQSADVVGSPWASIEYVYDDCSGLEARVSPKIPQRLERWGVQVTTPRGWEKLIGRDSAIIKPDGFGVASVTIGEAADPVPSTEKASEFCSARRKGKVLSATKLASGAFAVRCERAAEGGASAVEIQVFREVGERTVLCMGTEREGVVEPICATLAPLEQPREK